MQVKHIRNCSGDSREVYVGRGSALGNDFRQDGEASRTASIKAYRAWLWKKLQAKDARVWQAMRTLKSDSILMCHCHPKPCHADIIVKAWTWLKRQGLVGQQPERAVLSIAEERRLRSNIAQMDSILSEIEAQDNDGKAGQVVSTSMQDMMLTQLQGPDENVLRRVVTYPTADEYTYQEPIFEANHPIGKP